MLSRPNQTLVLAALLAGCGGEVPAEPGAPVPDRPAIAGTYFVSARFDELTSPVLGANGWLGLGQPSPDNDALGGAIRIGAELGGTDFFPSWDAVAIISVATGVQDVNLSPGNVISFTVAAQGTEWSFSGTVVGQTAAGRHTLTDGVTTLSGDWSMSMAEMDTRGLQPSTTAGQCIGLLTDGSWYNAVNGAKADCYLFCPFCNFIYGTVDLGPLSKSAAHRSNGAVAKPNFALREGGTMANTF